MEPAMVVQPPPLGFPPPGPPPPPVAFALTPAVAVQGVVDFDAAQGRELC
jgi:hypothetical protein